MPRLCIVDRHAVKQDKHLVERAASHRQVRLCAIRSATTYIQARQVLQHISNRIDGQCGNLFGRDSGNDAVSVGLKFSLTGHHQHFLNTKLLVSGGWYVRRSRLSNGNACSSLIDVRFLESKSLGSHQHNYDEQCRLASLEQFEISHGSLDTTDSYLAMHRAKCSIALATKTLEAYILTTKKKMSFHLIE